MKYTKVGASLASIIVIFGMTNIVNQPASASTSIGVQESALCWWCQILSAKEILKLPDNQVISIAVVHGPESDQIRINIPKTLSSSILNQTATGFALQPEPPAGPTQNQTATGFALQPEPPAGPTQNQTATGFAPQPNPPFVQNN